MEASYQLLNIFKPTGPHKLYFNLLKIQKQSFELVM